MKALLPKPGVMLIKTISALPAQQNFFCKKLPAPITIHQKITRYQNGCAWLPKALLNTKQKTWPQICQCRILFFQKMKIFLDANILIRVVNKEYPLFTFSSLIVRLARHSSFEVYTSPLCLAFTFYFAEKKNKATARQKNKIAL